MKPSRLECTGCAQTSASPVSLAEIGPGRRVKLVAVQAGNRLQRRALAGTIGTDDAHDFTFVYLEIQAVQGLDIAIGYSQIFDG